MASSAEAARLRLGARVAGKYKLSRLLGVGGMGAVYEAEHAFTGKRVALKILHAELATKKGFGERFLREAQSASKIGHPGIVDVYDAGEDDDGTLYLALELLQGEDLGTALARGTIGVLALARITSELLAALAAAHANGVVHRDLKPENVFLATGPDGVARVKLLDFGIAKQLGTGADQMRLTTTGTVLGTPYYMSPEQARGKEVDGRSDLWALGSVLFDALSGQPPFPGENYNEVLASILTDPIPSLAVSRSDLPADIIAVVDRALRRDRDERWQTADTMREALDAFLATRPSPDPAALLHTTPRTADPSASGIRDLGAPDSTPVLEKAKPAAATSVDGVRSPWPLYIGAAVLALVIGAVAVAGIVWASNRSHTPTVVSLPITPVVTAPAAPLVGTPIQLAPLPQVQPPGTTRPVAPVPPLHVRGHRHGPRVHATDTTHVAPPLSHHAEDPRRDYN